MSKIGNFEEFSETGKKTSEFGRTIAKIKFCNITNSFIVTLY